MRHRVSIFCNAIGGCGGRQAMVSPFLPKSWKAIPVIDPQGIECHLYLCRPCVEATKKEMEAAGWKFRPCGACSTRVGLLCGHCERRKQSILWQRDSKGDE